MCHQAHHRFLGIATFFLDVVLQPRALRNRGASGHGTRRIRASPCGPRASSKCAACAREPCRARMAPDARGCLEWRREGGKRARDALGGGADLVAEARQESSAVVSGLALAKSRKYHFHLQRSSIGKAQVNRLQSIVARFTSTQKML